MRGSLIAVAFFAVGVVCGRLDVLPGAIAAGGVSTAALCALMFAVAFGVGREPTSLVRAVQAHPRLALLPVATIVGTLAGSLLLALADPTRTAGEWCAVGAGMGYYSLSSVLIGEYRGPELGTLALLANIVREIISLLGAPVFAKVFGKFAPISAAGINSMDVMLPSISRYSGKEMVPAAILHGIILEMSVPLLVSLFCGM